MNDHFSVPKHNDLLATVHESPQSLKARHDDQVRTLACAVLERIALRHAIALAAVPLPLCKAVLPS